MSKSFPAALITAFGQETCQPYFAIKFEFDSGHLRLWTGYGDRTILSETYTGGGHLLDFTGVDEVADLSASSFSISLSGVDPSIISLALQENWQNRKCTVYVGDRSISSVGLLARGYVDKMLMTNGGQSASIQATMESPLVRGERASNWRYTDESHQSRHDGDTFFSFVADIQDLEVKWGRQ